MISYYLGSVLLDVEDEVLPDILNRIASQLVEDHQLHELDEGIFKWAMQLKHRWDCIFLADRFKICKW